MDSSMIKNVRFEIHIDKNKYRQGEKIKVNYIFHSVSDTKQKIVMKDLWGFPIFMGVSIINENDSNICKDPSRHILCPILFPKKPMKKYYKTIKPGKPIEGQVILQDIPLFEDSSGDNFSMFENDSRYSIPVGKYKIIMTYNIILISNEISLEIE